MAEQTTEQTTTPNDKPPEAIIAPPDPPPPPPVPTKVDPPANGEEKRNGDQGKVLQVPTSDFKKIKDEARDRGRREAFAELDAVASEQGFESFADALKALGELNKKSSAPPTPKQPAPPQEQKMTKQPDKKPDDKAERESQRLADERMKLRKDWRASEKKRRDLQRQLDSKDGEMAVQKELFQAGVKDVDYVARLLVRELAGKSQEEVSKFDRKAFIDRVRSAQPYLFGETVVPATTGTNGAKPDGSQPAPAPAGKPTVDAAKNNQFDATKATKEEVRERLHKLGLDPHLVG